MLAGLAKSGIFSTPPEVRLVLREDARGDGMDDVPAKEQLEEIVGDSNGAEGNRDIGHAAAVLPQLS